MWEFIALVIKEKQMWLRWNTGFVFSLGFLGLCVSGRVRSQGRSKLWGVWKLQLRLCSVRESARSTVTVWSGCALTGRPELGALNVLILFPYLKCWWDDTRFATRDYLWISLWSHFSLGQMLEERVGAACWAAPAVTPVPPGSHCPASSRHRRAR